MNVYDWEGVAAWVLGRASGDALSIARGLAINVYTAPMLRTMGVLAVHEGRPILGIKAKLSPPYREHAIAHEIGHWALRETGTEDTEAGADYVAAAILMPRDAYRARVAAFGMRWEQLALGFGVTETAACLRFGEVMGAPLALVAPAGVRVRGPDGWAWPSEPTVRGWARNGAPGLAKSRLRDDRRRVVLVG